MVNLQLIGTIIGVGALLIGAAVQGGARPRTILGLAALTVWTAGLALLAAAYVLQVNSALTM